MKADTAPLRVLIIDDSEISREVIEGIVESGGMEAMSLSSALGATAIIAKQDIRVLVVDMNMPLMSGSAFGAVFRKNERLSHVKLILITGDSETELRRVGT